MDGLSWNNKKIDYILEIHSKITIGNFQDFQLTIHELNKNDNEMFLKNNNSTIVNLIIEKNDNRILDFLNTLNKYYNDFILYDKEFYKLILKSDFTVHVYNHIKEYSTFAIAIILFIFSITQTIHLYVS